SALRRKERGQRVIVEHIGWGEREEGTEGRRIGRPGPVAWRVCVRHGNRERGRSAVFWETGADPLGEGGCTCCRQRLYRRSGCGRGWEIPNWWSSIAASNWESPMRAEKRTNRIIFREPSTWIWKRTSRAPSAGTAGVIPCRMRTPWRRSWEGPESTTPKSSSPTTTREGRWRPVC